VRECVRNLSLFINKINLKYINGYCVSMSDHGLDFLKSSLDSQSKSNKWIESKIHIYFNLWIESKVHIHFDWIKLIFIFFNSIYVRLNLG